MLGWYMSHVVWEVEMVTCSAFGCNNNTTKKTEGVSFHRFPADPKLRKKWTYAVRRKDWAPHSGSTLCSTHFREKWFDRTSLSVVRLREGAVPDIFPAIESALSRAMKRKAEENSLDFQCATSNNSSSAVFDKEEGGSKRTVLHHSKLPDGSSCELLLSKGNTPRTYKKFPTVRLKTPASALKSTTRKSTTPRPNRNRRPRTDKSGSVRLKTPAKESTARKSTVSRPSRVRRTTTDKLDSDSDSALARPTQAKPLSKATQTTVTLQQARTEMIRLQQEVLTLRQQLELARDDNKRLQTRLNLMGPLTWFSGKDLKALADLLNEGDASSSEDDLPNPGVSKSGPGDIVVPSTARTRVKGNQRWQTTGAGGPKEPADPNDIWDSNEVQTVPTGDDVIKDPRHQPAVNVVYKQKVGSEDMFLQMGRKTPMTSSCESMIITLTMKGETMKDIDCNITEKFLDIRSPLYRYHMPFPNSVDPDTAEAEWNTPESQLIITVDMVRELDAVNF